MNKTDELNSYLKDLMLTWPLENHETVAKQAASEQWTHTEYLTRLMEGEHLRRRDNRILRRIQSAHFPVAKTLDSFNWSWPKAINRPQIQNLCRLQFIEQNTNVIFLGPVGVGKTHLASAIGYAACMEGHSVLFTSTVDMINTLAAAQAAQRLKQELKKYLTPRLLVLDELGYLPIDKFGADLLFQVISARYERGPIVLTTNKPFKHWPTIFNNDSTLTAAVLDRLLHHAESIVIQGQSYRMKDQPEA
ncbi:MAG: IS21-like element helper ATPase IstB [bacterium]